MKPELIKRYETELEYLYSGLGAFERARPRMAELLRVSGGRSDDPEIRRLLDAVALMSAKLGVEHDQQSGRLVEELIRLIKPTMAHGLPSYCVLQLAAERENALPSFDLALGTSITLPTRGGSLVRYAVAHETTIHPLGIADALLSVAPFGFDLPRAAHGSLAMLEISMVSQEADKPISETPLAFLDFHIRSGQSRNMPIVQAIWQQLNHVLFFDEQDKLLGILPGEAFAPLMNRPEFVLHHILGTGSDNSQHENTNPADPLRDLIAYPGKESLLRLEGLGPILARCETPGFKIRCMFASLDSNCLITFEPDDLRTQVVPVINAFQCDTDPTEYSFAREAAIVSPAVQELADVHVLQVQQVASILPDRELALPEFCRQSYFTRTSGLPVWQERQRIAALDLSVAEISFSIPNLANGNDALSESVEHNPLGLTLYDETGAPETGLDARFRFFARTLCSNGTTAAQVPINTQGTFDQEFGIDGIFNVVTEPTAAHLPPQDLNQFWVFLNLTTNNMNSLFDAGDPTKTLQETISLSCPDLAQSFASAIRQVEVENTIAQVPINGRYLMSAGVEVSISMAQGGLPVSDHAFAVALSQLIRQYCPFDRFVDIRVRHESAQEPFYVAERLHGSQQCQ